MAWRRVRDFLRSPDLLRCQVRLAGRQGVLVWISAGSRRRLGRAISSEPSGKFRNAAGLSEIERYIMAKHLCTDPRVPAPMHLCTDPRVHSTLQPLVLVLSSRFDSSPVTAAAQKGFLYWTAVAFILLFLLQ